MVTSVASDVLKSFSVDISKNHCCPFILDVSTSKSAMISIFEIFDVFIAQKYTNYYFEFHAPQL